MVLILDAIKTAVLIELLYGDDDVEEEEEEEEEENPRNLGIVYLRWGIYRKDGSVKPYVGTAKTGDSPLDKYKKRYASWPDEPKGLIDYFLAPLTVYEDIEQCLIEYHGGIDGGILANIANTPRGEASKGVAWLNANIPDWQSRYQLRNLSWKPAYAQNYSVFVERNMNSGKIWIKEIKNDVILEDQQSRGQGLIKYIHRVPNQIVPAIPNSETKETRFAEWIVQVLVELNLNSNLSKKNIYNTTKFRTDKNYASEVQKRLNQAENWLDLNLPNWAIEFKLKRN